MTAQAGWYVDPRDSSQYRYWDGERWSQSTQPIPTENAGLSGAPANPSLSSGGAGEPVGSGAFGTSASGADSAVVVGDAAGDAPADLMWTSGFGDDATSSRPGGDTFSPGEAGAPSQDPQPESPWQPGATPGATDDVTVAAPAAFTPTPPAEAGGGGPMFQRTSQEPTTADPAFTPGAPTPTPPAEPGGSKIDQYTMPAGHVPAAPTGETKRSRRKRGESAGAEGSTPGAPPDDRPRRRERPGEATPDVAAPAGRSSLPPGAKPVKARSTSRLPLLLGVLGVVVVAGALILLLGGGDDEGDVATDDPSAADVTTAPTVAPTEPTAPTVVDTTVPTTEEPPVSTVDPALESAYSAEYAAEITRACEVIKADPGRLTEDVIQFNESWSAIGVNYESLQRAVNECSQAARDAAYEAMVGGG